MGFLGIRIKRWTATSSLLVAGCLGSSPDLPGGSPVECAAAAPAGPLRGQAPGPALVVVDGSPADRYRRPVITETRILAAWVPEHLDAELDVKIGAHWVYFRLEPARWRVAGEAEPDNEPHPPAAGEGRAIPELAAPFQGRGWVVPYRPRGQKNENE